MSSLGILALRWVIHAVVVMISVAMVSPRNPSNTLPRALLVTVLVAVLVTLAAGILQAAIGFLIDLFFIHGRLG